MSSWTLPQRSALSVPCARRSSAGNVPRPCSPGRRSRRVSRSRTARCIHAQLAVRVCAAGCLERRRLRGGSPWRRCRGLHRTPTAALGGASSPSTRTLATPEASALIAFLTRPEQMVEGARIGQYPARPALYETPALARLAVRPAARRVIERAMPRPVTPVYTELSSMLQISLHRDCPAAVPGGGLGRAAREMRAVLRNGRACTEPEPGPRPDAGRTRESRGEARLAARAACSPDPAHRDLPARLHDMGIAAPARPAHAMARPAVHRAGQLRRGAADARFWAAMLHTLVFTGITVSSSSCRPRPRARAEQGLARPRPVPRRRARAVGDPDRRVRAALALHVRRPGRNRQRAAHRCRSDRTPFAWFVRQTAAWVPSSSPTYGRSRRSSHCCCWRDSRTSTGLYEAARIDGAGAGGSSATSRCRCSIRRCSSRSFSARSMRSACST